MRGQRGAEREALTKRCGLFGCCGVCSPLGVNIGEDVNLLFQLNELGQKHSHTDRLGRGGGGGGGGGVGGTERLVLLIM